MAWTVKSVLDFIVKILQPIVALVTPIIKEELDEFLLKLHAKAVETDNPYDDLFTAFLLDMFGIEHE